MISVIIPTYNEQDLLTACLESVRNQNVDCELIVSDGGSTDGTQQIASEYTGRVLNHGSPNLPLQLNSAAEMAKGDLLLFLHADSRLTPGCLAQLERLDMGICGGAYTMQLEGDRLFYRLLSAGGNLYCRLTRTYFGDRGLFVRSAVFNRLGGFKKISIMSDVDFSYRLRKVGRTVLLPGPVISSARKFKDENPWRTLYLIFYALIAFKMNKDPEQIQNKYYRCSNGP